MLCHGCWCPRSRRRQETRLQTLLLPPPGSGSRTAATARCGNEACKVKEWFLANARRRQCNNGPKHWSFRSAEAQFVNILSNTTARVLPPGGVDVYMLCGLLDGRCQLRHAPVLAAAATICRPLRLLWRKQPIQVAVDEPAHKGCCQNDCGATARGGGQSPRLLVHGMHA